MYILWNPRSGGWLTGSATYSSSRADAKQFDFDEMLRACRRQYKNGMAEFGLLPISIALLLEISQ